MALSRGVVLVLVLSGLASARAEAPGSVLSTANLPPGWTWPPSAEMRESGARCLEALAAAGVEVLRVEHPVGKIATPIRVPSMSFGGLRVESEHPVAAPVMDCELARSLTRQAAPLRALGVHGLVVGGIYRARRARLRGRSVNLLSRHALGLAVDVRAFITRRGHRLSVRRHYGHPLVQRVDALLRDGDEFRAVVTPRSDRAHRDHIHLSAKMTIDAAHPDASVDLAELLRQTLPRRAPHPKRRIGRSRGRGR